MGGHGEFVKRGQYRLGRVSKVFPQIHQDKTLVRRALVAVNFTNDQAGDSILTLIERDIAKLALLELAE